MHGTPEKLTTEANALDLLMPIQFYYLQGGRTVPEFEFIDGGAMPEPYVGLLVHDRDMTPTLAQFHDSEIHLDVLSHEESGTYLMRSVVLKNGEGNPVEFGAIGIRLEVFNEPLRKEIVGGSAPLGGLLEKHRFPHSSHPKAYFQVRADDYIARHLEIPEGMLVYGRCNSLTGSDGLTFADIVEILPSHG